MSNNQSSVSCGIWCWGLAALIGVLAAILLLLVGDWRFIQALFAGIVITILLGALLSWILCRSLPDRNDTSIRHQADPHPIPSSKESARAAADAAKSGAVASAAVAGGAVAYAVEGNPDHCDEPELHKRNQENVE